jgi:hypothetical protein
MPFPCIDYVEVDKYRDAGYGTSQWRYGGRPGGSYKHTTTTTTSELKNAQTNGNYIDY